MPPTCLTTASPFGLALSALMICARFASGIMRSVERGAWPSCKALDTNQKGRQAGRDARRADSRRVLCPQFVWRNRP